MRFTRNRGSKRLRARRGNGRFAKSTVANTFGLHAPVCASCRSFNPHPVGDPRPETCKHCGKPLVDVQESE